MITERSEAIAELKHLGARANAALEWVCPHVSDAMLRSIAECDYGFDADLNFELLSMIRSKQCTPDPLEWNPAEVLRLTRWSDCEGEAPVDHLKRYFACASLACATAARHSLEEAVESTVIRLIDSASVLGDAARWAGFQSVALLFAPTEDEPDEFMVTSGLVLLGAPLRAQLRDQTLLPYLIDAARKSALTCGRSDDGVDRFTDLGRERVEWRRAARRALNDPRCTTHYDAAHSGHADAGGDSEIAAWVTAEIVRFLQAFEPDPVT